VIVPERGVIKSGHYVERKLLPFDVLLDKDMAVSQAYEVIGEPTFVLVSTSGQIVFQGNELPDDYKRLLS
jgi:peroxiredoxin